MHKIKKKHTSLHLFSMLILLVLLVPLHAQREVRVGVYENPPKLFVDSDRNFKGFFIDLTDEIAKQKQWSVQYVLCEWEQCLEMLQSGELDIMPDVAHTPKREELFLLTDEPVISSWSVLYRHKSTDIDSIIDLEQKRIAVLKSSIQSEAIEEELNYFGVESTYIEVDCFDDAFVLLNAHEVDAVLVNRFYTPKIQKNQNFFKTNILLKPSMLKYAFHKDAYELKKEFDETLSRLKKNETSAFYIAKNKWLTQKKSEEIPQWLQWVLIVSILCIVGLLILVFLFRYLVKKKSAQLLETSEEVQYLAQYDLLTGVPNRSLFMDRLAQTIVQAKRKEEHFAIILLNIDHFREINEEISHIAGDKILSYVANTLQATLYDGDTVARFGGDEFILILNHAHNDKNYSRIIERIETAFIDPYIVVQKSIFITFSAGVVLYPENGEDSTSLINAAQIAMKKAKKEGRNNFQFFSETLTQKTYQNLLIVSKLRENIEQKGFELYYQPKINAHDGLLHGSEVLIRWFDKELGEVFPTNFIPIAEEHGLIAAIGGFVLEHSIKQYADWMNLGYAPGTLAVNVSVLQLRNPLFAINLLHLLEKYNFDPKLLEIEITESQLMENPEQSISILNELHDKNIAIAIDDFGTGYSSLSYLKLLPINVLKIDRSFIKDTPENKSDCEITQTIIAMAKSLKFKTVAEGVETDAQKIFLQQNGCDIFQGYLFSKPLSAEMFEKMLKI